MFNDAPGGADMATKILRLPVVQSRTGLSKSTIYKRISEGSFPAPISLGDRAVGWVDSAVEDWVRHRIEESQETRRLSSGFCL